MKVVTQCDTRSGKNAPKKEVDNIKNKFAFSTGGDLRVCFFFLNEYV